MNNLDKIYMSLLSMNSKDSNGKFTVRDIINHEMDLLEMNCDYFKEGETPMKTTFEMCQRFLNTFANKE